MADFLATLVARSQGQLDSVRPRRLSRFEAEPGPPGVGGEEAATVPGGQAPARSPSPPRATAPRDDQQATGAPPLPPAPDAAPMPAARPPQTAQPDPSPAIVSHDDGQHATSVPPPPTQAAPAVEPRQARQHAPAPPPDRTDVPPDETPRPPVRPSTTPLDTVAAVPTAPPEMPPEPPRPRADGQPSPRDTASRVESLEQPAPIAADALRLTTRPTSPADDQPARGEREGEGRPPRVTVTIGRVEVKQAPSPEPARRPPTTSRPRPKLSLDDYLARSRGVRR